MLGSYTLYAIGFRFYFTPLAGVLFAFPSRYWFTIGCQGVFSLIPWSGQIQAEFHVHRLTWDPSRWLRTSLTRLSRSLADFSKSLSSSFTCQIEVPLPREDKSSRFGLFRFRSPLLTESLRFLFLGLLRCFTSPRLASPDYEFIRSITADKSGWVVPFGDPRINACLRLPVAYRNLLRPSSPLGTKASTVCT